MQPSTLLRVSQKMLATSYPRVRCNMTHLPTLYLRSVSTGSAEDSLRKKYVKICLQSLQQDYSRIAICAPSASAAALDLLSQIPPPSLIPTATKSVIVSNSFQEAKNTHLLLKNLYPKSSSQIIQPDYDDLASLRITSDL